MNQSNRCCSIAGLGNLRTPDTESDSCTDKLGDEESVSAGKNINAFREDAEKIGLNPPIDWAKKCKNQAVMCCWPRDRQCGDNNGNCDTNGCEDSDPADNTNLCFLPRDDKFSKREHVATERGTIDIFAGESEGDMHCHGFMWDEDPNNAQTKYIGNNFYYVSMYDHLYTRGYVENIPTQEMCGCIEEMAPMARSDCTQMDIKDTVTIEIGAQGFQRSYKSPQIDFNACKGSRKNNDLYQHALLRRQQGKLSNDKLKQIQKHLFGWKGLGNEEENACYTDGIPEYYKEE